MKNSKKSKLTSLIVLLIVAVIIIALAGTYAKYITSISGKATATVAKWDIDFKDNNEAISDNFDIDITNVGNHYGLANGKIQPGSHGDFTITVTNNSDTSAKVTPTITDNSSAIFKNGQFTVTPSGNIETEIAAGETKDIKIDWKWNYVTNTVANGKVTGNTDGNDTAIGEAQQKSQQSQTICSIKLVATQVEPSTNN